MRGFTLVELLSRSAITTLVLGATMGALGNAVRAADAAALITGLNDSLRNGMDLMVRDLLQGGQGLPSGRVIQIPSGTGAAADQACRVRQPRPTPTPEPSSARRRRRTCLQVTAIIPGPGRGPVVLAGQPTDMITVLAADSAFDSVRLTRVCRRRGATRHRRARREHHRRRARRRPCRAIC